MKSPRVNLRSRKLRRPVGVMGQEDKIMTKATTQHKQTPDRQQSENPQLPKTGVKPVAKLGKSSVYASSWFVSTFVKSWKILTGFFFLQLGRTIKLHKTEKWQTFSPYDEVTEKPSQSWRCVFKKKKKKVIIITHVFIFNLYARRLTQFSNDRQSEEHRHLDDMVKSGMEEGLKVIYTFFWLHVVTFERVVMMSEAQTDAG